MLDSLIQWIHAYTIIFVIGMVVAFGLLVCLIGIWIFRPVDRAAKDREHPTQFTILDFFCLFFIIQLSMATIHWQLGLGKNAVMAFVYILDAFAWFACGALWMKSVQLMSRAGIQQPSHRVLFLAFVIPATPALLIFTAVAVFGNPSDESFFNLPVLLTLLCLMPLILYASAKSTRRIVAAAEPSQPALVTVELVGEAGKS